MTDGDVDDPDCAAGCLGPDGYQGTLDDTLDHACTHSIDQGAICHNDDQPSQIALPGCRGCGVTGACDRHRTEAEILQPVIFGCIDFYSTECLVDGMHMDGTGTVDNRLGGGADLTSYMTAMRTFAQCVDANIEVPGYCHGPITDASALANHQVCVNGVTSNIAFHIRIPFNVHVPGEQTNMPLPTFLRFACLSALRAAAGTSHALALTHFCQSSGRLLCASAGAAP